MTDQSKTLIRMGDLTGNRKRPFFLKPDAQARAALAAEMDLLSLENLRFEGELAPKGRSDVGLKARLRADVVQPCVVTLQPVPSKLDVVIERTYLSHMDIPEGDEVEMPEDDTLEAMPDFLNLEDVMAESLALSLPDYPRAEGAELQVATAAEEGAAPIDDTELKPFAALAALKDRLKS